MVDDTTHLTRLPNLVSEILKPGHMILLPANDIANRLTDAVVAMSRLITDSYPKHLCAEAKDRRRIDKLAEEVGEVVDAYNGWVGENPRKGRTNGLDDVLEELLDVAACALAAYEHLTGLGGRSVRALAIQTERKHERLLASVNRPADRCGAI